MTILLS